MNGRRLDDSFLREIARQYTEHVTAKRMPAPAIAKTEQAPVRTVHRWIHEARKRGLLPPGTPPDLCGGKVTPKPLGSAGEQVARNVKLIREAQRLSTTKLAALLAEAGQPIPATGITRIEKGQRRVDVDDLIAIAAVFGVRPETLWAPPAECEICHGAPPRGFTCKKCGAGT